MSALTTLPVISLESGLCLKGTRHEVGRAVDVFPRRLSPGPYSPRREYNVLSFVDWYLARIGTG
jgi:hypothetical protein